MSSFHVYFWGDVAERILQHIPYCIHTSQRLLRVTDQLWRCSSSHFPDKLKAYMLHVSSILPPTPSLAPLLFSTFSLYYLSKPIINPLIVSMFITRVILSEVWQYLLAGIKNIVSCRLCFPSNRSSGRWWVRTWTCMDESIFKRANQGPVHGSYVLCMCMSRLLVNHDVQRPSVCLAY